MRSIQRIRRRDLLGASAAAGAAAALAVPAIAQDRSPNEKLSIAGIGVGGQGGWDIGNCASENIVALCDVDDRRCAATVQKFPKAKRYRDFRKMLDEMDKQIDAVVVSTPDHTHAPAAAMAMRMGKHCYCEKPLTHTVYEARVLAEIAKEKKLATQMGTQIHAEANYRRVVELVQAGADRPGPRGPRVAGRELQRAGQADRQSAARRPQGTPPVPEHARLGPLARPGAVPAVPSALRAVPVALLVGLRQRRAGRFLLPLLDLAFWALKLRHPTTVEAEGPVHPESTARWTIARHEYPARGDLPPVTLTWYHGGALPGLGQGEESPRVGQRRAVRRRRRGC